MNIPKWMQKDGQMYNDPRVVHHWEAVRKAQAFADALNMPLSEEDIESVLLGVIDGVPYVLDDDDGFEPIKSSSDFWILYHARREAAKYEDRGREWPEREDPFDETPVMRSYTKHSSAWEDFIDHQKDKMIDDIYAARKRGKKWAQHGGFMIVALQALADGHSFERARELAFMVYHASFVENVVKGYNDGLVVVCADFKSGKRKDVQKRLPWKYLDMAAEYINPRALLQAARCRWPHDKDAALEMVVTAFAFSLTKE